MVQITIATTTERKTVMVENGTTVRQVVEDNGYATSGMTYHLNGVPVSSLDNVLAADTEGNMLVAVPAQKAGC